MVSDLFAYLPGLTLRVISTNFFQPVVKLTFIPYSNDLTIAPGRMHTGFHVKGERVRRFAW